MIRFLASFVPLFFLLSCVGGIDDHPVAGRGSVLDFTHPCSEADRNYGLYWQNFALFEGGESSVLGEVQVGWSEYDRTPLRHILFQWHKTWLSHVDPSWIGYAVSLDFKMYNTRTGESILGEPKYDRMNLLERWESGGDEYSVRRQDVLPQVFSVGEDQIPHPEDTHVLSLVFKNTANGEVVELEGPSLTSLPSLWNATSSPEEVRRKAEEWDPLDPDQGEGNWLDIVQDAQRYSIPCSDSADRIRLSWFDR